MIITENINHNGRQFTRTYSSEGFMIERDGVRYSEAIDPIDIERTYTETDIFIKGDVLPTDVFQSSELIDIRIGADGTVYASAGEAVRGQASQLKNDINVQYDVMVNSKITNKNSISGFTWAFGYPASDGTLNGNRSYIGTVETIKVSKNDILKIDSNSLISAASGYVLYSNKNGTWAAEASFTTSNDYKITIGDGITEVKLIIHFTTDLSELLLQKPILYINPQKLIDDDIKDIQDDIAQLNTDISSVQAIIEQLKNAENKSEKDDDKTYFYVHITSPSFDFRTVYNRNTGASHVDWGDGSSNEISKDDDLKHIYNEIGDYIITISGLTAIGNLGLRSVGALYKAILSNQITSIGNSAFDENDSDMRVYLTSEAPPTVSNINAFAGCVAVYIPSDNFVNYLIGWKAIPYFDSTNGLYQKLKTSDNNDILYNDISVTVGNGGDFSTINDALMYLSQFYPLYKNGGINCYIKILAGTIITEQIYVKQQDLQYITIVAEESSTNTETITIDDTPHTAVIVDVDDSNFNYTADFHDTRATLPLFAGENAAKLPTIGCIFRLKNHNNEKDVSGLVCNRGSECVVLAASGFDGFHDGCISNNESSITIREGVSRNMTRWGVHARHNGEISARSCVCTKCGTAAYADRVADLDVREAVLDNSTIAIQGENISRINANGCHCNHCGSKESAAVKSTSGATVNCNSLDIKNCVGDIFSVSNGGFIWATSPTTTGIADEAKIYSQETNIITKSGIIFS